ncbi:MAG: TetR/AcrR family transcriptional regulator [Woeseiaceae bacterium]|nr:TetR/AcrR family transcriptional regulator [Woeseiaceae bacterium]
MPSKRAQTRRERVEAKEETILESAREAFLANGFDGARMSEIASRAGVAEGTVYLYFKNKNALLEAVVKQFYEGLTEAAEIGVGAVPGTFERLEFLAQHHLRRCLENWQILDLMIGLYRVKSEYRGLGYELNKAYVAVFDGVYREGIARGDLRDDVPLWVARDLFYGTLEYTARTLVIRGRAKKDLNVAVQGTLDVLKRGIAVGARAPIGSELESLTRRLETAVADLKDLRD